MGPQPAKVGYRVDGFLLGADGGHEVIEGKALIAQEGSQFLLVLFDEGYDTFSEVFRDVLGLVLLLLCLPLCHRLYLLLFLKQVWLLGLALRLQRGVDCFCKHKVQQVTLEARTPLLPCQLLAVLKPQQKCLSGCRRQWLEVAEFVVWSIRQLVVGVIDHQCRKTVLWRVKGVVITINPSCIT